MFGNVSFGLALMQGVAYGLVNSYNRSQAGRTLPKSNVVSVEQTVPHGLIFSGDTSNTTRMIVILFRHIFCLF